MPQLMRMVQVSLVGFAVGGAFLSFAYLDLPYYVMGFVISSAAILRQRERQQGAAAGQPAPERAPPADIGSTQSASVK